MDFLKPKPITVKGRGRRGSEFPIGSSLPNHDAKVGIGQTEKRQRRENKENQGQTASSIVRAKTI